MLYSEKMLPKMVLFKLDAPVLRSCLADLITLQALLKLPVKSKPGSSTSNMTLTDTVKKLPQRVLHPPSPLPTSPSPSPSPSTPPPLGHSPVLPTLIMNSVTIAIPFRSPPSPFPLPSPSPSPPSFPSLWPHHLHHQVVWSVSSARICIKEDRRVDSNALELYFGRVSSKYIHRRLPSPSPPVSLECVDVLMSLHEFAVSFQQKSTGFDMISASSFSLECKVPLRRHLPHLRPHLHPHLHPHHHPHRSFPLPSPLSSPPHLAHEQVLWPYLDQTVNV